MHFGRDVGAARLVELVRYAYDRGIRSYMTADVYGEGEADRLLGEALASYERDSYYLIGAIGHDFYKGERQAEKGFPRFTNAALRSSADFGPYISMAAERSLERLKADHFDLLFLHNPDSAGYTSPEVWSGLDALRARGVTRQLGLAPGPANGFTLDVLGAFERFGESIDWAMIILNPLEPWPGQLVLDAAQKHNVRVLTRVVEYGGLFHDYLKPGMKLGRSDHRSFRPAGWIETAQPKLEKFREIAKQRGETLLQLAAAWALAQPAIEAVVPTLIEEDDPQAKTIEAQIDELAKIQDTRPLPAEIADEMSRVGDNRNCMALKGASAQYIGPPQADQWPLGEEHRAIAKRSGLVPDRDLYYAGDPRDIREIGLPVKGVVQASTRRLFMQLQAFTGCENSPEVAAFLQERGLLGVLYQDIADPRGIAILTMTEEPDDYVEAWPKLVLSGPLAKLERRHEFAMIGRTYSAGREADLDDTLIHRPMRNAFHHNWAIWYPLRRKSEFELLTREEQGKILMEHAMIGRNYGQAEYAHDIRLACYGLDKNDNEFVLGILGQELYPLSRLVQDMRKTQQTAKYIQSLGPFFVGRVIWAAGDKAIRSTVSPIRLFQTTSPL